MARYRKKPVVIDALPWDGTDHSAADIVNWILEGGHTARYYPRQPFINGVQPAQSAGIEIDTLEGSIHASVGDWIIRGVQGEFYPCKPNIFEATYEEVG